MVSADGEGQLHRSTMRGALRCGGARDGTVDALSGKEIEPATWDNNQVNDCLERGWRMEEVW